MSGGFNAKKSLMFLAAKPRRMQPDFDRCDALSLMISPAVRFLEVAVEVLWEVAGTEK